jgi:hypothetical protein
MLPVAWAVTLPAARKNHILVCFNITYHGRQGIVNVHHKRFWHCQKIKFDEIRQLS